MGIAVEWAGGTKLEFRQPQTKKIIWLGTKKNFLGPPLFLGVLNQINAPSCNIATLLQSISVLSEQRPILWVDCIVQLFLCFSDGKDAAGSPHQISRRKKPKRRSTGVVSLEMEVRLPWFNVTYYLGLTLQSLPWFKVTLFAWAKRVSKD